MNIELLGAIDYKKVEAILEEKIIDKEERDKLIKELKEIEICRRSEIVSTAGRLSRFAGDVFEILGMSEENTLETNTKFAKNVIGYGHESISDHDYLVFALQDVSVLIEQIIIAERFSSFTIKSRREVDFSNVGYYTPDFQDENGNILSNNKEIKAEYQKHIQHLFDQYSSFVSLNVSKEDARFVLPYCFHSNIVMGVDAHTLKDMIIKFTKRKYSNIQEVREFGEKLYEIAKKNCPYIIEAIDQEIKQEKDPVEEYLNHNIKSTGYNIIDQATLINCSENIDDTILTSAIMRRYQYDYGKAKSVLYELSCIEDQNFREDLMRKIVFEGDKLELTQVNFQFQIPLSFAVLTHLTRHRTHDILIPDFSPNVDLMQYKVPPKIGHREELKSTFDETFASNKIMYDHFKEDYGIREEDLVYFTLAGNMVNVVTSMDGKTLEHILRLRECEKAQWETRKMAIDIHKEIKALPNTECFSSILGSTCMTQGICNEGKESCGKIYKLNNNKNHHSK